MMKFKTNILGTILLANLALLGLGGQSAYADGEAMEVKQEVLEVEHNQESEVNVESDQGQESEENVEADQSQESQESEETDQSQESLIENKDYKAENTADNPADLAQDPKFVSQANHLEAAVNDRVNVVNSNAYYNYASQELKADYENAIENAKSVLARLDQASYQELRDAMQWINTAKGNIKNQVNQIAKNQNKKNQLREAIKRNQRTLEAAKQLKSLMPNYAKKFERQLNGLMAKSEVLIQRANKALEAL